MAFEQPTTSAPPPPPEFAITSTEDLDDLRQALRDQTDEDLERLETLERSVNVLFDELNGLKVEVYGLCVRAVRLGAAFRSLSRVVTSKQG